MLMKRDLPRCPCCGSETTHRLGVYMSRTERKIFDKISMHGYTHADMLVRCMADGASPETLFKHISNIRDRLLETDWTIINSYSEGYKLTRREPTCEHY